MENKKSQRKRRKHWLCSFLFLNCFLIFFYTNWIWLLSVVAMSVEDFTSSQAMIHYGEDIAKNTGWYLSEYSGNTYSWNLAVGLCNTNLSWFCSLTLVSLSPLMALVSASKCWYPSSFCIWPTVLPLNSAACTVVVYRDYLWASNSKSECPALTAPLSSRPVCTTICWTFPLHDPQGSLNSVNVNKFDRMKVLTEGGELGKVEER